MPSDLMQAVTTFGLVAIAEMGDKSQLVCMGLAARHRGLPVFTGAMAAFALLNLIAVVFGAGVAQWLPVWVIAAVVAVLFLIFGIQSWRAGRESEEAVSCPTRPGGALLGTFLLIFAAEFGDKTQLTVAALAGSEGAAPVWIGATAALALTTLLGVVAGRTVLQRLPLRWIHRLAAVFFLAFAAYAGYEAVTRLAQ